MRLLRNRVDLQSLEQPRRLQEAAMAVLTWADEISSVCRQMQTSLDASTASRAILVPRYPDPGSPSSVLWRPVRQDDRPAILRTAAVLRTAASQLSASIRAADEAIGRHNPQGIATHRAAAAAAVKDLRRVLGHRDDESVNMPFTAGQPRTVRHTRTVR